MKMKQQIINTLSILCIFSMSLNAQKYFTKEGTISFYSETPVENIEATNYKAVSIFDVESGAIEWSALIKAFSFEKALMQEHFNENYMESSKYPKAKFKGVIQNIADVDFTKDGTYALKVSGSLEIHGVSQNIENEATFVIFEGAIRGVSNIQVKVRDYDIDIPSVVADKIAETVDIKITADYQEFKK